jgi:plastocyanin
MQRKSSLVLAALVLLAGLIAGAKFASRASTRMAAGAAEQPRVVTVEIHGFKFNPETVTVRAGDMVVWKNDDSVPHTATEDSDDAKPVFDSGSIQAGAAWRYVAQDKGSYNYICSIHPNMEGKLIVQ